MFSLLYCTISITIANGSVVDDVTPDVKDHGFIHSDILLYFSYVSSTYFVSTLLFVFFLIYLHLLSRYCLLYSLCLFADRER